MSTFKKRWQRERSNSTTSCRPGPCPTTNALRIMELEGLPVPGTSYDPIKGTA